MEEMKYDANQKEYKILHQGIFEGRKFCILSLGEYPTAYAELKPEEIKKSHDYYNYNLDVHGGFTYLNDIFHATKDKKTIYIGWDYAHYDDYVAFPSYASIFAVSHGKRWTTKEIFEEVKSVIRQLNTAKWHKCANGDWILEAKDVEN